MASLQEHVSFAPLASSSSANPLSPMARVGLALELVLPLPHELQPTHVDIFAVATRALLVQS